MILGMRPQRAIPDLVTREYVEELHEEIWGQADAMRLMAAVFDEQDKYVAELQKALRRHGKCSACNGTGYFDHGYTERIGEVRVEECEPGSFGERPVPHRECPCRTCNKTGLAEDVRALLQGGRHG